MKIGVVLTDLDGTLLEPDGTLRPEARDAVSSLLLRGIAVSLLTSKTPAELGVIMADLELRGPAGFENGAGVRHADGGLELVGAAVPVSDLRQVLRYLQVRTGIPVRSLEELDDAELTTITRLSGSALGRVRERHATLPLVVDPRHDKALRKALPRIPGVRLVRGNRFLHLQGQHDKAGVVPRLLELGGRHDGRVVACGDAPNDTELLAAASIRIIVPSQAGPDPELTSRFPDAIVAPYPHGRGWAAAMNALMDDGLTRSRKAGTRSRAAGFPRGDRHGRNGGPSDG
jgi:mannosyl-3-phosphoglycerate phosphatase